MPARAGCGALYIKSVENQDLIVLWRGGVNHPYLDPDHAEFGDFRGIEKLIHNCVNLIGGFATGVARV